MPFLSAEQLEELRQFDTPTVSNAIEFFRVRKRTDGFMNDEIRQIIPAKKPMVGYAVTCKLSAMYPETERQRELRWQYLEKVRDTPKPTIAVMQDIDPHPIGAYWGDVQASVHLALGGEGVVTSGGVRDLDEMEKLNFHCFARTVLVSHAYVHIEDYDCPVSIGGLTVYPGDLLHADKHGVCVIPHNIADKVADACRDRFYAEEPVLAFCREAIQSGSYMDLAAFRKQRELMEDRLINRFNSQS